MARNQSSQIVHEAKARLLSEWSRIAEFWRDEVARKFAHQFWEPLNSSIAQYFKAVEELEDALDKAGDHNRF
jgi:uncharacterized protein YukE